MTNVTQAALTVGMPTLAVLIGILNNNLRMNDVNRRIDEQRAYMDRRFDGLQTVMDARFDGLERVMDARFAEQKSELLRVEQVMDARLRHLEENR
jgi:hypothetical protein